MEKVETFQDATGQEQLAAATDTRTLIGDMYVEHAAVLRRVAIRKFRVPPAEAEGLVHDVFINFLLTTRVVRGELRTYLIAAICNACRNFWRSRRSEQRVFSDRDLETADAGPDDLFEGLAANLIVAATLAKLAPRCREILKLYYLHGESTASIAATMNTTPANVNYQMHVCRKRARAMYEQLARRG